VATVSRRTLTGLLASTTRIAFGPFYVAPLEAGGWGVFDTRARRGDGCLADDMPLLKALEYAQDRYLGARPHKSEGEGEKR
jgi:hypothetical protein